MKPNFIGKNINIMKKEYNTLVNSINNSIPSKNNSFRIMAYNVKEFEHCNNKSIKKNKINIMEKLIDELNPNIIGYIEYINWFNLSSNPSIFEIDYDALKKRIEPFTEELMMKCFHPEKLNYYLTNYSYDIGSDEYI